MECHWILPAELPHTTLLYRTFLSDFPRLSEFYSHPPTLDGVLRSAGEIRLDAAMRRDVTAVLRRQNDALGCDDAVKRNLDRLAGGAVAIVTGQQVGLFGGPALSVYKALTAIRVAEEVTRQGIDAVPVFWMATEDHDLAEVNHCYFGARGAVERFELDTPGAQGRRVGEILLGEAVQTLAARAAELLRGMPTPDAAEWITSAYRPAETLGSAFAKLMTRMMAGRGLILMDPSASEVHRLSGSVIYRALKEHGEIAQELLARSAALETSGHHVQVKVTEQTTLLFRIVSNGQGDGQRVPIRALNGGFLVGEKQESREQLLRAAQEHPEQFSASALLRPAMQDSLLPTAAYIGGAAEIAYYAQASVVHARLLGRIPAVLSRAGFTLLPKYAAGLLEKYGLDIRDVFSGRQPMRAKLEAAVLPQTLHERFAAGEQSLRQSLEALREPLGALDKTLLGALDTATEKILYQFGGLQAKAGRAEGFRTGVLDTHERELMSALFPNGGLQERSLSLLPFLAAHGGELLDRLYEHIRVGGADHCVVSL